ncbi:glycosyltransferase [Rhodoferax sp.]|uniref:glycosyltransferase n=1 Tax=Rhodoferax sp. TaxID=50421 RepID=UPI0026102336|nr:glycosyltransferase [Rhodoferax sp.]MDD2808220.1 glycosyltransferase [Rhodoferax sp.]MDD4941987.1 glycosyltransferase [Rhodoferax sp.]
MSFGHASNLRDKKILILIGSHLATAPRVQKEAKALREAGAVVYVRGTWWSPVLAAEDMALSSSLGIDFAPVVNLSSKGVTRTKVRILQRFARELFVRFGVVTGRVFGLGTTEMLNEARCINADLTMVHSEAGLWVGKKLLADGRRVGVDFEDWFSQDLPLKDRVQRPIKAMQRLERHLLQHANCSLTTSQALANSLAHDADTTRIPVVAPNCFPTSERAQALQGSRDVVPANCVSFHWFSQTIGPARGLEVLAQALPLLRGNWQLSLRGSLHAHQAWFDETFTPALRLRIQVLEPVSNAGLLARTMSHDVGLSLEEPYCLNKELTASNKIFEYLRAGLAVIATATQGQQEVMQSCPGAGQLIPPGDPVSLANAMQRMLDDAVHLQACKLNSVEAGEGVWSWERHAPKLVQAIAAGLTAPLS